MTLGRDPGRACFDGAFDAGLADGAQRGQRRVCGEQVTHSGLVEALADRTFQRRGDAGQGIAQAVGQPRLIGGQVDVEAIEHPQLRQQVIRAGIQPVDLLAPGPAGIGQHVGIAAVGFGLARIQVGGTAHHQPRHIRHRHTAAGRPPPVRAGRSSLAGRSPGPVSRAGRHGPAAPPGPPDRWPRPGRTAAPRHCPGHRRSARPCQRPARPTHPPAPVWPPKPLPPLFCLVRCAGRPPVVRSPSSTLRISDQAACPHQRFTHQRCRRQHPPGHHDCRGQMSHTGTAGLPRPRP